MSGSSQYIAIDSRIDRYEFMDNPDISPILKAMFSKVAIYPNQIESRLSNAFTSGTYAVHRLLREISKTVNIYLSSVYKGRDIQVELASDGDDIVIKFTEKDVDITQDILVRVTKKCDLN